MGGRGRGGGEPGVTVREGGRGAGKQEGSGHGIQ